MLSKDLKRLIIINILFSIMSVFTNLFLNLYIWENGRDIKEIALFNLMQFLPWSFSYILGVKFYQKSSFQTVMKLSSILPVIIFFVIAFIPLGDVGNIKYVAIFLGFSFGIYAAGYNQTVANLGKKGEFTKYFQIRSIAEKVVGVFVPLSFSFVIYFWGYKSSFALVFLVALVMFIYAQKIPKVTLGIDKNLSLLKNIKYKKIFQTNKLKKYSLGMILGSMFLDFQKLFVLIYTFSFTDNQVIIALITVFYSLVMMGSMKIYKKFKLKRNNWLLVGIAFICLSLIVVLIDNVLAKIIANTLLVIGTFYFKNIFYSDHYEESNSLKRINQISFFIWREGLFSLGRILVSLFIVFFMKEATNVEFLPLFVTAIVFAFLIPVLHKEKVSN